MTICARPWTPAEAATVRRMASAGYLDSEIGRKLGRSRAAVRALRRRLEIGPGITPAVRTILARLNLRRTYA